MSVPKIGTDFFFLVVYTGWLRMNISYTFIFYKLNARRHLFELKLFAYCIQIDANVDPVQYLKLTKPLDLKASVFNLS